MMEKLYNSSRHGIRAFPVEPEPILPYVSTFVAIGDIISFIGQVEVEFARGIERTATTWRISPARGYQGLKIRDQAEYPQKRDCLCLD